MDMGLKDIAFMILISPLFAVMIMVTIAVVAILVVEIFAIVKKILRESKKD